MIHSKKIHSLTEFVRNSKSFAQRIQKEKEPVGLTVNGKVKLVVLDVETFEDFCEVKERQRFIDAILEGERAIREGRSRPLERVFGDLKTKHGL